MIGKQDSLVIICLFCACLKADCKTQVDVGEYLGLNSTAQRNQFERSNSKELSEMRIKPKRFSKSQKLKILEGAGDILYVRAIGGEFTWSDCEQEMAIRKEALGILESFRNPNSKDLSLAQFYYQRSLQRGAAVLIAEKDYTRAIDLLQKALLISQQRLKSVEKTDTGKTDSDEIADTLAKCRTNLGNSAQ